MRKSLKKVSFFMICLIVFSMLSSFFSGLAFKTMSSFNGYTIVIDAGHGGLDVK